MGDSDFKIISKIEFPNFFSNIEEYNEVSDFQYREVIGYMLAGDLEIKIKIVRINFHLSLYEFYFVDSRGCSHYFMSQQIEMSEMLGKNDYLRKITYFVNKKLSHVADKD